MSLSMDNPPFSDIYDIDIIICCYTVKTFNVLNRTTHLDMAWLLSSDFVVIKFIRLQLKREITKQEQERETNLAKRTGDVKSVSTDHNPTCTILATACKQKYGANIQPIKQILNEMKSRTDGRIRSIAALHDQDCFKPTQIAKYTKSKDKLEWLDYLLTLQRPTKQVLNVFPVTLNSYFANLMSGNEMSQDELMSNDLLRISSFRNFPSRVNLFPSSLSNAGFYFTGRADEVRCYACGVTYNNWTSRDNPAEIHKMLSPSCSHVTDLNCSNNLNNDVPVSEFKSTYCEPSKNDLASVSDSTICSSSSTNDSASNADSTTRFTHLSHFNEQMNDGAHSSISSVSDKECLTTTVTATQQYGLDRDSNRGQIRQYTQSPYNPCRKTEPTSKHINLEMPGHGSLEHTQNNTSNKNEMVNQSSRTEASGYSNQSPNLKPITGAEFSINGVIIEKPKFPNYAPLQMRISSFQGWPSYLDQTPHDMAKAGFLYAGYQDYTRCFFCGGGLRNWAVGDDPWVEHARLFPKCIYLRENKGDRFVKAVQDKQDQLNEENSQRSVQNTSPQLQLSTQNVDTSFAYQGYSNMHLDTAAARSVLEMGYSNDQVINAILKITSSQCNSKKISASDIMHILLANDGDETRSEVTTVTTPTTHDNMSDNIRPNGADCVTIENRTSLDYSHLDDAEQLIEENRQLKDQRLCKICLDLDATVAFLPCGHLVCCSDCARAMRKCPICRAYVKGTVKTFIV